MCLLLVFQQCDFDFAGNWHAEAVEEYEEEELRCENGLRPKYLLVPRLTLKNYTPKLCHVARGPKARG